ncbi:MAG: tetratricopeptide repeat protein, partial [Porticoccaceae bacterium]|nr:tetratricopeptide repeat protein [Porticoccaceae bacterium]
LYTVQEDYRNAALQLEAWMKESTIVGADAKMLLAQIYYQLDRKKESLRFVEEAIADVESKDILPKEGWWGLQRVLYYEKGNYPKVTSILEKMVKHYPKWTYWRQLGGMYGEQERETDRLVATEVVYLNNQLETESQVMSMAYMYLGAEVPYRAAKIIEKGMKDGIITRSAKNLEVLGTAWYQSKDLQKAVTALESASKKADTGNLQARLAGIYLDLGRDTEAYRAADRAAKKGGMKRPESNYLIMGNALINLHCYSDAIKAFGSSIKVATDEKSKRYPRQWIKYAEAEGDRLDKLRKVGATVPSCKKG